MRQLRPDRDFPDVSGGILFGALAIIAPWAIAEWLGYGDALGAAIGSLGKYYLLGLAALYGTSFLVIGGVLRGLFMLLGISVFGGNQLLDRIAAGIAGIVRFVFGLITGAVSLCWSGIRALTRPIETRLFALRCRLQEEHQLWKSYREEFYQTYDSFAAFKRAFRGETEQDEPQEEPQQEPPRAAPEQNLEAAFDLFGLSLECSREEFKARFRELIRQVHPDKVGPNGMATQLNEARTLIRKQKGWT